MPPILSKDHRNVPRISPSIGTEEVSEKGASEQDSRPLRITQDHIIPRLVVEAIRSIHP